MPISKCITISTLDGKTITAFSSRSLLRFKKLPNCGRLLYYDAGHQYVNEDGWLHRIDGPAVIYHDSFLPRWYLSGYNKTAEINDWMKNVGVSYPWDSDIQLLFELRFL